MGHLGLKGLAPQTGTPIYFFTIRDKKKKNENKKAPELFVKIKTTFPSCAELIFDGRESLMTSIFPQCE